MGGDPGSRPEGMRNTSLDRGKRVCRWLGLLWGLHTPHTSRGTASGLSDLPRKPEAGKQRCRDESGGEPSWCWTTAEQTSAGPRAAGREPMQDVSWKPPTLVPPRCLGDRCWQINRNEGEPVSLVCDPSPGVGSAEWETGKRFLWKQLLFYCESPTTSNGGTRAE